MLACHDSRKGKVPEPHQRDTQWLGWKPDTPDHRDWKLALPSRKLKLAPTIDLRLTGFLPPVWDQGDIGSCTAHAIGAAYEYMQREQGLEDYTPSRLFIYWNERKAEGDVNSDGGAELRTGLDVINKLGAPHETLWPYNTKFWRTQPPVKAYADGLLHQCIQYRRVPISVDGVSYALAKGLPVIVGFNVFESFDTDETAKTGIIPIPKPTEQSLGGHAVLLVGRKRFAGSSRVWGIFRNSWGPDWGDHGYFYMPLSYFCNEDVSGDYWVIQAVEK